MSASYLSVLSAAAAASSGPPAWTNLLPIAGMAVVFWFLILRPQMQRQKALQSKQSALKKGDSVLTGGGHIGKVVSVDEHYADIELAPGMKVKTLKSTIVDVIPPGGSAAAND